MRLSPSIVLLRTQTDERLTELAAQGSEPAFTALVERYRRMVLRACMRVLPEARAEDATQQVFVAAWKALTRGDDVRAVRPWLLKIARNTALNALRTPGYEYDELAESLSGGSAPQAELERRDVMRQTLSGLASLPENQREALLRTAVQGASHADIARDLGISEGATRQLVLRARATLRSAASAITPLPLLSWAASGSTAGVAEIAAGGSTAGVALLAKAGAVVVIAGGAAATPAIVHKVRGDKPATARAAERAPAHVSRTSREAASAPIVARAAEEAAATATPEVHRRGHRRGRDGNGGPGGRRHHGRHRQHGRGHHGHGGAGSDDHGAESPSRGPSGEDTSGPGDNGKHGGQSQGHGHGQGHGHDDTSEASGPSNEQASSGHGHGTSGGKDHAAKDNSGHGNGNSGHGKPKKNAAAPIPTAVATATPTPTADSGKGHSGHGGGGNDGSDD